MNCLILIINLIGRLVIKTLMKTLLIVPVKPLSQTFPHRHIGNVSSSNLIGLLTLHYLWQARIYFVLFGWNTGTLFRRSADNTQSLHHVCHLLTTNQYFLAAKITWRGYVRHIVVFSGIAHPSFVAKPSQHHLPVEADNNKLNVPNPLSGIGELDSVCRGAQSSFYVPLCLMIELSD